MQNNVQILQEKNIKITPQRLGIYNIILDQEGHLDAEEIFGKAKDMFPAISLATVYSVLDLLKEKKLIQEIRIDFHKSRYDKISERHHHFQCKQCGMICDVEMPLCHNLEQGEVNGHKIEEFHGYFYGICCTCRNADKRE